jgi:prepilin-type N-terminal cleavage/methylation domain-containing protein
MRNVKGNGFTLIELITVIIVISILASFAVSSFYRYRGVSVETRNHANLVLLTDAIERFNLNGNSFTNLQVDPVDSSTSITPIMNQLVAAGVLDLNKKITPTEIKAQLMRTGLSSGVGETGQAVDAGTATLVLYYTIDD